MHMSMHMPVSTCTKVKGLHRCPLTACIIPWRTWNLWVWARMVAGNHRNPPAVPLCPFPCFTTEPSPLPVSGCSCTRCGLIMLARLASEGESYLSSQSSWNYIISQHTTHPSSFAENNTQHLNNVEYLLE